MCQNSRTIAHLSVAQETRQPVCMYLCMCEIHIQGESFNKQIKWKYIFLQSSWCNNNENLFFILYAFKVMHNEFENLKLTSTYLSLKSKSLDFNRRFSAAFFFVAHRARIHLSLSKLKCFLALWATLYNRRVNCEI